MSITSINDDYDWTWASDTLLDSGDYRIVDQRYIVSKDFSFSRGDQNLKLIYRAGYETIPDDLKQSCIEEVSRKYKHRRDIDIETKSLEDGDATYSTSSFLPTTMEVLHKYKTMWVN